MGVSVSWTGFMGSVYRWSMETTLNGGEGPEIAGSYHTDEQTRWLYATDASSYQELPRAVAFPESVEDIQKLISYAREHGIGLIPRTAGTSLAGQVVGSGIVVDVSRTMTEILEIDPEGRRARVRPGVVRNELNMVLEPYGLFFAPETSTQNRAMLGGMLGNNSCGANSIKYGSTRENVISAKGILSDGSEVTFEPLDRASFEAKCAGDPDRLETRLYRQIREMFSEPKNMATVRDFFPHPDIHRRNTGYALDMLMNTGVLDAEKTGDFNFCQLLAGSEGTLMFTTEIEVKLEPLPPKDNLLLCAHFSSIEESLRANIQIMEHEPFGSELLDHYILECTEKNIEQRRNRFFVEGKPAAILVVDLRGESQHALIAEADAIEGELKEAGLGYAFPRVTGEDIPKVWNLRKAGLGLLSTMPGDEKPVAVIEDAAVRIEELPAYMKELTGQIRKEHSVECVHYAHAGSGEIHLRPILDLKSTEGNRKFREIAQLTARLVKQYGGALSGEHGDGRLRGEFIEQMVGSECFQLMRQIKDTWDPDCVFNPGKIFDTPPMNTSLRYQPGQITHQFDTYFRWDDTTGVQRAAELCNGSGDCRKTEKSGGTMCPSYMATRDEKATTRGRANMLRHMFTRQSGELAWDAPDVKDALDLCLSCKGCKSECPSNVDMAKLKAEFTQHYYDIHGVPWRARMISEFALMGKWGSRFSGLWNLFWSIGWAAKAAKSRVGFAPERSMPPMARTSLHSQFRKYRKMVGEPDNPTGTVYLFCDEFTNFQEPGIGMDAVRLLERLGYRVAIPEHIESGRSSMSKGLLKKAKGIANKNVQLLKEVITPETPLVGIEPSAILSFRDEYPDLVERKLISWSKRIADSTLTIEEFIMREFSEGRIEASAFHEEAREILLHGHCQQKALIGTEATRKMLSIPKGYRVREIPSGCCGMAGSFGYEAEHYEVSMKIGELILFPRVRGVRDNELLCAPGTSCRHQILDGTGKHAQHPVSLLYNALKQQ